MSTHTPTLALEYLKTIGIVNNASNGRGFANPYDKTADLNARARSYLDVNCSVCHAPGGEGLSQIDLRFHTPLTKTRLLFPYRLPSTEPGPPT